MKTYVVQCCLLLIAASAAGFAQGAKAGDTSAARAERNREAIACQLGHLARLATEHYNRPVTDGGGGGAFDPSRFGAAWTIPADLDTTANAVYTVQVLAPESVVITGVGAEAGDDPMFLCANGAEGRVQVACVVSPTATSVVIHN